jgi:acyl-coenzyme A synthetase/AMP-(fatty) acid ligase
VRTQAQFITHPQLGRLYKTGDLGKYSPSNVIEFIGRDDFQVKINGFRVELQEIEFHLLKHPSVAGVVVVALDTASQNKTIAAYVILKALLQIGSEQLVNYLGEHLPKYMIPLSFVFIDRFPLSPNGKVDRKALLQMKSIETA